MNTVKKFFHDLKFINTCQKLKIEILKQKWIENDKNDSGGTCERTKHLIACETIECVIGSCVIIENKEKCNSFVFK